MNLNITYSIQANWIMPPVKRLSKMLSYLYAMLNPLQWINDLFFTSYRQGITLSLWNIGSSYGKGDRVISDDNFTVWEYALSLFSVMETYQKGDIVYSATNIYKSLLSGNSGNIPSLTPSMWESIGIQNPDPLSSSNTVQWTQILKDWVGTNERAVYTSKVLQLEYILNKRFATIGTEFLEWNFVNTTNWVRTSPYSDIYILPINNNFFELFRTANGSPIIRTVNSPTPIFRTVPPPVTNSSFSINVPTATLALITEAGIRAIADKYVIAGIIYDVIPY